MGGSWSGKIKTIAASTVAHAVGFGFCRANDGLLFAVSDLASGRDRRKWDEKNRVGASNTLGCWSIFSNALSQSAKIVGHAVKPQCTVGACDEATIVHGLAHGSMDDGISGVVRVDEVRSGGVEAWRAAH